MRVYFMTNRNQREAMPFPEFGFTPTADVVVGHAEMADPVANEAAMDPLAIKLAVRGVNALPEDLAREVEQSAGDHLLLYIHGFNYSFREAMQRSGWLTGWFGAGDHAVKGPILCFSFPSQGTMLSFERDPAAMHGLFGGTYQADYRRATDSGPAAARALTMMAALARRFRATRRPARVTLLAHSMGNHVLDAALAAARDAGTLPADDCFDRVILAAADEARDSIAPGGALRLTAGFAKKVYLYYNRQDLPLLISEDVHRDQRLGRQGPPTPFALPANVRVINCSTAPPLDLQADLDWQRHQYYRLYAWVRDDMALVMNGAENDVSDFPQRRRSAEIAALINLDSPAMQTVSLTHPLSTVG